MNASTLRGFAAFALVAMIVPRVSALSVSVLYDTTAHFVFVTDFTSAGTLTATGANGGTVSLAVVGPNELVYTVNSGAFAPDVFTFHPDFIFSNLNPLNLPILDGFNGSGGFFTSSDVLISAEFTYGDLPSLYLIRTAPNGVDDRGYTLPLFGALCGLLAVAHRRRII